MRVSTAVFLSSFLGLLAVAAPAQSKRSGLSEEVRKELRELIRKEVRAAVRDALEDAHRAQPIVARVSKRAKHEGEAGDAAPKFTFDLHKANPHRANPHRANPHEANPHEAHGDDLAQDVLHVLKKAGGPHQVDVLRLEKALKSGGKTGVWLQHLGGKGDGKVMVLRSGGDAKLDFVVADPKGKHARHFLGYRSKAKGDEDEDVDEEEHHGHGDGHVMLLERLPAPAEKKRAKQSNSQFLWVEKGDEGGAVHYDRLPKRNQPTRIRFRSLEKSEDEDGATPPKKAKKAKKALPPKKGALQWIVSPHTAKTKAAKQRPKPGEKLPKGLKLRRRINL